jgi:hypothetical protein
MPKFTVCVREVWIQMTEVDAPDKETAIKKVESGEGEQLDAGLEYSHTLSSDTWTVDEEEVNPKETTKKIKHPES